jgi:hypothetical protein
MLTMLTLLNPAITCVVVIALIIISLAFNSILHPNFISKNIRRAAFAFVPVGQGAVLFGYYPDVAGF